jgi:hypothetical protein
LIGCVLTSPSLFSGFLSRGQNSRDSHKPWDGSDRRGLNGGGVNANGDKFVYMHHDGSIMEEPPGEYKR